MIFDFYSVMILVLFYFIVQLGCRFDFLSHVSRSEVVIKSGLHICIFVVVCSDEVIVFPTRCERNKNNTIPPRNRWSC